MKKTLSILPAAALLIGLAGPGRAQETADAAAEPSLSRELARLNQNVEALTEILRTYLDRQKEEIDRRDDELMLKRLELGLSRLAPLEKELKDLETLRTGAADRLKRSQAELARVEEVMQAADQETFQKNEQEYKQRLEQLRFYVKMQRDSLAEYDQRIMVLENDVTEKREDMKTLEEAVDKRLGLR